MDKECRSAQQVAMRKGPWTLEEDKILINYVTVHGEGLWNSLARMAGLNRTGKSCRLRWLNYLKPDVRRGNITPEEELVIRQLHSKWGNRWSKIARHLPGRTDNEIKNYWRTQIQKHLKQNQPCFQSHYMDPSLAGTTVGGNSGHDMPDVLPTFCPQAPPMTQNLIHEASTSTCFPQQFDELSSIFNGDHSDDSWSMDEIWPLHPFHGC